MSETVICPVCGDRAPAQECPVEWKRQAVGVLMGKIYALLKHGPGPAPDFVVECPGSSSKVLCH